MLQKEHKMVYEIWQLTANKVPEDDHFAISVVSLPETECRPAALTAPER